MADFQDRLRGARRILDGLYGEIDDTVDETIPGYWSAKNSVSDAIDAIDNAIASCPREVPADA